MPIYEYGCQSCGQRIEVMHGVHDTGPATCAECGGPMRKLLSPPAIVFKGSGWAKKERSTSSSSGRSAQAAGEGKHTGTDGAGGGDGKAGADSAGKGPAGAAGGKSATPD